MPVIFELDRRRCSPKCHPLVPCDVENILPSCGAPLTQEEYQLFIEYLKANDWKIPGSLTPDAIARKQRPGRFSLAQTSLICPRAAARGEKVPVQAFVMVYSRKL